MCGWKWNEVVWFGNVGLVFVCDGWGDGCGGGDFGGVVGVVGGDVG